MILAHALPQIHLGQIACSDWILKQDDLYSCNTPEDEVDDGTDMTKWSTLDLSLAGSSVFILLCFL